MMAILFCAGKGWWGWAGSCCQKYVLCWTWELACDPQTYTMQISDLARNRNPEGNLVVWARRHKAHARSAEPGLVRLVAGIRSNENGGTHQRRGTSFGGDQLPRPPSSIKIRLQSWTGWLRARQIHFRRNLKELEDRKRRDRAV